MLLGLSLDDLNKLALDLFLFAIFEYWVMSDCSGESSPNLVKSDGD
jgi:hypothetical protein